MKPPESLERVLVVVTATGQRSFDDFYRDARIPLYRALALTLGDVDLAREAVDEAMVRGYARWDRLAAYDSPEGWAYRVALNWARSQFRRQRRETLWERPPDRTVEMDPPDLALRESIGRLGRRDRAVVVCRYLLDWSTADTAIALGVPEATVKTRLRRALARLAADIERGQS